VPVLQQYSLLKQVFVFNQFGGKRVALALFKHQLLYRAGGYSNYRGVNWRVAKRLVFICTGNICRSPFAEYLASSKGRVVGSFGLLATTGSAADRDAQRMAARWNISLVPHRATNVHDSRILPGDVLLGMEPQHCLNVEKMGLVSKEVQISLLGLWCASPLAYLPDPFGMSDDCFAFVFSKIAEAVTNIDSLMG
jgi:protein-tyrosine phosphatase